MVRNIDLVEALVFYGGKSIFGEISDDSTSLQLLPGVENLMEECRRDDTAVLIVVEEPYAKSLEFSSSSSSLIPTDNKLIHIRTEEAAPPNPQDLWEAIHSVRVQPKGFGGSSGFGSKAPDPVRTPLPKHCVVLCHTEDQCRAARYVGTRTLCLTDNALADAVIDDGTYWETIYMDDIATPGSFWLNPPHPKDDEGNGVDVLSVIEWYEETDNNDDDDEPREKTGPQQADDDYLAAILADMDPL
ncbi:MAG: hypothetical protein SGILL_002923 [Bacillariaceae sp.]